MNRFLASLFSSSLMHENTAKLCFPPFSFKGVGVSVLEMLPVWGTAKALAGFISVLQLESLALCLESS